MYFLGRKLKFFASVFMLVACLATGLIAQDISGTIGGTILDPSGAAVPNAKVTVTNTDRNQVVRTVTTDASGTYSAPLIPIGNYSIKVEATGFKTETRTGIVLNVNDDLKINITLQVGAITDTVESEGSRPSRWNSARRPAPPPSTARRCANCRSARATTSSWSR